MGALKAWIKRFSWEEQLLNFGVSAAITVLLKVGFTAVNNPITNNLLFYGSVFPLSLIGLWLIGRVYPRRPVIVGDIEQIAGRLSPTNTPGVFIIATVTNRGLPSSLDQWHVIARNGGHEYSFATVRHDVGYPFRLPDGRTLRFADEDQYCPVISRRMLTG